jgi:hypothetical protein
LTILFFRQGLLGRREFSWQALGRRLKGWGSHGTA